MYSLGRHMLNAIHIHIDRSSPYLEIVDMWGSCVPRSIIYVMTNFISNSVNVHIVSINIHDCTAYKGVCILIDTMLKSLFFQSIII